MRYLHIAAISFATVTGAFAEEVSFADSHLEAARDLLTTMNMEPQLRIMFEESLRNSMPKDLARDTLNPVSAELTKEDYDKANTAFLDAYLDSGIEIAMRYTAEIYGSHFSESELRECNEFYSSPISQKVLKTSPILSKEIRDTLGKTKKINPDVEAGVIAMLNAIGIPFEKFLEATNAKDAASRPNK